MLITMSDKEIDRADFIRDICCHRLRRKDAAALLVKRLMNQYRQSGIEGLVSKRRAQVRTIGRNPVLD
ncbi:hypothetical protein LRP49_05625 [Enterovibrio sp. ZSDZ35]|uniref:Transposase n=1 Tax=Enterovibrio qingdaonensis TaxID=2899818 RepID=A0ABT5QIJ9_9GAMM|nr:hypothetical protein [Enterovibrio sp. ZSDZ35]MDD1780679.1 hypothetical protein [Enterovibrio sp. ZSDZ35]